MMESRFGLDADTIQKVDAVFKKFSAIKTVIIYGSRAKGNYRNGSDIDITLKGENLDLNLLHEVSLQIDNLLLPYSFDISLFHQIDNPELKDHINRVGGVLYSREKELTSYSE
jgi:predicted nucleotidyltransferase